MSTVSTIPDRGDLHTAATAESLYGTTEPLVQMTSAECSSEWQWQSISTYLERAVNLIDKDPGLTRLLQYFSPSYNEFSSIPYDQRTSQTINLAQQSVPQKSPGPTPTPTVILATSPGSSDYACSSLFTTQTQIERPNFFPTKNKISLLQHCKMSP